MAKRRIKKARITHVSLCGKGKNKMPVLFKDDDTFEIQTLTKWEGPEGELTALVYVPEHLDTDDHLASAEVVKEMCHEHARHGFQLDLKHDLKVLPREKAFVAQSFIVQKGDARFEGWSDREGNDVEAEGAWAQIYKIEDPELLKKAEQGEIGGVSMFGTAEVELLEKSQDNSELEAVLADLKKALARQHPQDSDIDMKTEELMEILKAEREATLAKIDEKFEALTKSDDSDGSDGDDKGGDDLEAPIFKGDLADAQAVAKYVEELKHYEAIKSLDLSDPVKMAEYLETLEKSDEPEDQVDVPFTSTLSKQQPTQTAPAGPSGIHYTLGGRADGPVLLTKEEQAYHAFGVAGAREINDLLDGSSV